jgi:outer membrane protein assembly complex protein YaeT
MRGVRRVVAILALVLVIVAGGLAIFLQTRFAHDLVISRVTRLLQQQNVEFSTEDLRYNLFELRLALRNVRVRSHDATDLPPFATIDRIAVDLGLRELLFRRRYLLQSGEAQGVAIHYYVAAGGRDNLPRPPRDPDEPARPLDYLIDEMNIRNATIRYENVRQRIDVALPVSTLDVDGDRIDNRHTLTFASAGGTMAIQDRRVRFDELVGVVDAGRDDLHVDRLDVVAEGARVAISGTLAPFADPVIDVAVRGTVDAARASRIAGLRDRIGGVIDIDANANGRLAAPAISGRFAGTDVSFRNLSDLDFVTNASYDMTARRIAIADLQLRAPFGRVSGHGDISLVDTGRSSVTATVVGLDAAAVTRSFRLPYVVASRVDAQVQAEWPGLAYLRASGNATAALTPTARASRSVIPVGGRINVTGRANALDAVLTRVTVASAELNGRVRVVDQERLAGQAQVRVGNVAQAISTLEAVLGRRAGTLVPVRVAGRLDGTVQLAGTVNAPALSADVQSPSLVVGSASGLALNASIGYTPARLAVRRLDVEWQQARAHATGTIGLTGTRPLDLAVTADALEVRELLRAVNQTGIPASGVVSVQGRVGGTIARPAGALNVTAQQLAAYNENWGTLTARADITGRQITIPDLLIDKPQPDGNGRITGTASYDLDRRTYALDVRSENLRLVGFTLPNGRAVRGTLDLNARGTGSLDRPSGTVHLAANDLQVDQYAVGRVVADAVIANQQATISASIPAYGTTANAVIATTSPYPATAKLRFENLQLAALPLNLKTPLEGIVRGTVDATGNLATPEQMQATALIDTFAGAWNQQPFSIDGPAHLRYANERLAIDRLRVVAQDSTINLQGELPVTEGGAAGVINVDARGNLATLVRYAPADMHVTGSGDVRISGTIRGTLRAIDPDLDVVVSNATLVTPQIQPGVANLNLRARVAGGEALIEQLTGNWGEARITARGRVPLEIVPALPVEIPRRGGPATFTASIEGLNVAQIPGVPPGLSGRVTLNAELSSSRADVAALTGRITFPEMQLAFNGLTLRQDQPAVVSLAGGAARLERVVLTGSAGTLTANGTVGLTGDRPINIETRGDLNVGALALFTDRVRSYGDSTINITAGGTLAAPELSGFVDLRNASFVMDEPNLAAESVNGRINLSGRRLSIAQLTGVLNGGTVTASGHVELGDGSVADIAIEVTANDVAFDAPLNLRTLSDARVTLRRRREEYLLEGQITIEEGGLTGDINFDEGILAAMQSRRTLQLTEQRHPLLERIRFDLDIDTTTPIIVDNNLARAEVMADLRVIGTPYEPGLAGRLTVLEESEITLNERRYEVERGVITFIGERRIQPSFDLLLNTTARNYDITVALSGTPGDTETSLVSDPALPEPDIMAILATGRTLEEMRGEEFEIAREQVLSYLTGRVGSHLGRGVEGATGLDTVRIEPNLIANEADPSARLTIGEDIADNLKLAYSVNLTDSNDQIWVAEYDVTRRFQTRGVRQSDNSYRFDLRHDVRIGGRPAPPRLQRHRPEVARVTITGDGKVPGDEVRAWLGIEEGDDFNFFAARNGVEKVEETLEERGYLQSRVRLQREGDQSSVNVSLNVTAGPRVDLLFEGANPPAKVVDEIRTKWRRGVFDTQRLDDSIEAIKGWLMADNYLQPDVQGSVDDIGPDERRVRFGITPGPRFSRVMLAFNGAHGISPDELDTIIGDQNLEIELFTDPAVVTTLLERYYREQGYLAASIDLPRYEFQGSQARVVLTVDEGPRFIVRTVSANGAAVVPEPTLVSELPLQTGDPFLPFAAENALQHIRDVYWKRGYNDVHSDYQLVVDREAGRVDVRFDVTEGPQTVVADVTVLGNEKTSDRLVREQVELEPGQPLDLSALARSRINLYKTQAFALADIKQEELASNGDGSSEQRPVRLNVTVREVQPIQLRYGLSYDTERGVGGILDLSNHNSLGKARIIGFRSRYDGEVRDFRGYFNQPSLRYWPIETTASLYFREESKPETTLTTPFNIDRRGASIQQERELAGQFVWNWGYRYERARTFDPRLGGILSEFFTVTPLTTSFTRETRDDVMDATRGAFWSHAFEYSPEWLGSDQAYIKYHGQYFHFIPLQPERRERFTNEILRPRLVYAGAVRLGVARPFGGEVPRSERFFAGGSGTLRGFEQNAVGGVDISGIPLGGDALFVVNNEVRFPLISIFDGVVFSDIGNVFPRISELSFTDLRKTAGIGLRVRTRWFLVRGDYGRVLDRRPGEPRGRFYFSLGQAF